MIRNEEDKLGSVTNFRISGFHFKTECVPEGATVASVGRVWVSPARCWDVLWSKLWFVPFYTQIVFKHVLLQNMLLLSFWRWSWEWSHHVIFNDWFFFFHCGQSLFFTSKQILNGFLIVTYWKRTSWERKDLIGKWLRHDRALQNLCCYFNH